ncbi:MAG: leucine-rich repeat domain-containing protein [Alloprevotella sp.]
MKKIPLLLAVAALSSGALQVRADEVKLTTGLTPGEKLQVAFNSDVQLKLTWGNATEETVNCPGGPMEIEVKDADLTISTVSGKIYSLFVQGNKLSALDVSKATNLKQLFAADNELTELNTTNCTQLEEIDVQGNKLATLDLQKNTKIKDVNVAQNELTGTNLKLSATARVRNYVTAHNELTKASTVSMNLYEVKTLWVQHNKVPSSLALSGTENLRSLCASSNELTALTMGNAPVLKECWVDNNQLTSLDFSKGSPVLEALVANDNNISTITYDVACKGILDYAYLQNNALSIPSIPSVTKVGAVTRYSFMPQRPYQAESTYALDTAHDFNIYNKNGYGINTNPNFVFVNGEGYTLVKGTDYNQSATRKVTFLVSHANVTLHMTQETNLPGMEFLIGPFTVGTPTGITDVKVDGNLSVEGGVGTLTVSASSPEALRVVSVAGQTIVAKTVANGTTTLSLPAGVYVVNGKKVLVR